MEYPKELLNEIKKNSQPYQLEGFLAGKGPVNATAMLVGEAPGRSEIETKVPFTGQAGKELGNELAKANLKRDDLYITSVVRSRPFRIKERTKKDGSAVSSRPNRTPTKAEIMAHAPLIDFEIQRVRPNIIATMGNISLKRLLGNHYTISAYHGQILTEPILTISKDRTHYVKTEETYTIFPLYHPAAVLYKRSLQEDIANDWQALFKLINERE